MLLALRMLCKGVYMHVDGRTRFKYATSGRLLLLLLLIFFFKIEKVSFLKKYPDTCGQGTTTARALRFFVHFFTVTARLRREDP